MIHYSPLANRKKAISGREDEFEKFKNKYAVSHEDVVAVACEVIREAKVPPKFSDFALKEVRGRKLTDSRLELIFNYFLKFDPIRKLNLESSKR